jgi:hypothetical protein
LAVGGKSVFECTRSLPLSITFGTSHSHSHTSALTCFLSLDGWAWSLGTPHMGRYTLRQAAIDEKRQSFVNCAENGFAVGTYEEMLPDADVVLNLTPDKQHTMVVNQIM